MIIASILAVLLLLQAVALLITAERLRDAAQKNLELATTLSRLLHP